MLKYINVQFRIKYKNVYQNTVSQASVLYIYFVKDFHIQ